MPRGCDGCALRRGRRKARARRARSRAAFGLPLFVECARLSIHPSLVGHAKVQRNHDGYPHSSQRVAGPSTLRPSSVALCPAVHCCQPASLLCAFAVLTLPRLSASPAGGGDRVTPDTGVPHLTTLREWAPSAIPPAAPPVVCPSRPMHALPIPPSPAVADGLKGGGSLCRHVAARSHHLFAGVVRC
jgi:hypothetical protein